MLLQIFGWVGSLAFAICGIPQAYECWKTGNAKGLSGHFLFLWSLGEVGSFVYVAGTRGYLDPLFANYALNAVFLSIIVWYKLRPRSVSEDVKE